MAETKTTHRPKPSQLDRQELIRRVAERVWRLWQAELRRGRERRGGQRSK